ncbi:MAG TPA: 2-phospho-L-lactate guanylyltransferase [Burkholderiales bacterium]|nr:2-phospho-L-lactate guanylyltransferase [Burkholderiales bacterium]
MSEGVFALVPVKDPALGKSRLAAVLDARAREALNLRLARQTFECCAAAFGPERTVVVTASAAIAAEAAARCLVVVEEPSPGDLNAALALAALHAIERGAQALLVVPIDLVLMTVEGLRAVSSALEAPGCVLVPDRDGTGTNLLGLRPARADLFRFGAHSLEAHRRAAEAIGLPVRAHQDAGLALDLDTPDDLSRAGA